MHRTIAKKMNEIAFICRKRRMERLEVFGSTAGGTDFGPITSDIDFLVEFNPEKDPVSLQGYVRMIKDLRSTMARGVYIVEEKWIYNPYQNEANNEDREMVFEELYPDIAS